MSFAVHHNRILLLHRLLLEKSQDGYIKGSYQLSSLRSDGYWTGLQVALLLDVVIMTVKTIFEISMALTLVKNMCELMHVTVIEIGQISALVAVLYLNGECPGPVHSGGGCDLLYVTTMRRN